MSRNIAFSIDVNDLEKEIVEAESIRGYKVRLDNKRYGDRTLRVELTSSLSLLISAR